MIISLLMFVTLIKQMCLKSMVYFLEFCEKKSKGKSLGFKPLTFALLDSSHSKLDLLVFLPPFSPFNLWGAFVGLELPC